MGYDGRDESETDVPDALRDRMHVEQLFRNATSKSLGAVSQEKQTFIFQFHEELMEMFETMARKNTDYAGDSPWGNLGASVEIGIHPALGILIRMQDKFKRIQNITKSGTASVADESIMDTMQDLAVYAILWRMAKRAFA